VSFALVRSDRWQQRRFLRGQPGSPSRGTAGWCRIRRVFSSTTARRHQNRAHGEG